MIKNWCLIPVFLLNGIVAFAQITPKDTTLPAKSATDTTINYDSSLDIDESMFDEMKLFLDSVYSPHSFGLVALIFNKGYYTYQKTVESETSLVSAKRTTFTPTIGYYHKSGFGITGIASFVNEQNTFSYYQFALTPSYDYLENKNFATGIGYTRYFTKDSLPFYTSPLQNEVSAYFTVRKWWFKPIVTLSYGWGNRTAYDERAALIEDLRLRPRGFAYVSTNESIVDFTLTTSIRHDFYWLDVFAYNDHIRLTPQITFTSGTQKFGFNESSNTYGQSRFTGANVLYSSEDYYLDGRFLYQPLALTLYLRPEYAIGKFYFQPQFILDYYFPATDRKLNSFFSLNAGVIF